LGSRNLKAIVAAGVLLWAPRATPDTVNRPLALWKSIKYALLSETGQEYFDTGMKGAMVPGGANGVDMFQGTLVSAKPSSAPSILVLSMIIGEKTPEVTLRLIDLEGRPTRLNRRIDPGAAVWFHGIGVSFSREPFMVTFDVHVKDLRFERR
jgi:hypothetical protein